MNRVLTAYLATVILVQAMFAAAPGIDLAVSGLFATDGRGFDWALGPAQTVNHAIRRFGEAVTFALIAGFVFGLLTGRVGGNGLRLLAYPVLCVAVACGGLVNLVLKTQIGRARPDTIVEFGGTARFSAPWQLVDECSRNCSFTSGEVALAASLSIAVLVIVWPHLARDRGRPVALLLAVGYVTVTALFRIGLGRHFLSDAVYSTLFAGGAALVLYPVLRIGQARAHLPNLAPRKTHPLPTGQQEAA